MLIIMFCGLMDIEKSGDELQVAHSLELGSAFIPQLLGLGENTCRMLQVTDDSLIVPFSLILLPPILYSTYLNLILTRNLRT